MTKRKCTAKTISGRRCRAWATRASEPPRCPAHDDHVWPTWTPPEAEREVPRTQDDFVPGNLLALLNDTDDATVAEEIAINRLLLRRLLAAVDEDDALQARDLMRIARLVFSGGKTVARLLREERALSGETADSVAAAIGEALDELALEWGLEL